MDGVAGAKCARGSLLTEGYVPRTGTRSEGHVCPFVSSEDPKVAVSWQPLEPFSFITQLLVCHSFDIPVISNSRFVTSSLTLAQSLELRASLLLERCVLIALMIAFTFLDVALRSIDPLREIEITRSGDVRRTGGHEQLVRF
jgi:hypothetical protein